MNNSLNTKRAALVDKVIVFILFIFALSFESLKTLAGLFTYGVFKKEILTTKSDFGFDFEIKIK